MIKIFRGGGGGGEGVAVIDACSGMVGVIKGSFQKHLKTGGWVKAKVVRRGEGVLTASPTLSPGKF